MDAATDAVMDAPLNLTMVNRDHTWTTIDEYVGDQDPP